MSLVNDALKKARLEATRTDVAKRGIPYPILGKGDGSPEVRWPLAIVLVLALAGVAGYLLYSAGQKSALERRQALEKTATDSEAVVASTAAGSGGMSESMSTREPADILLEGAEPAEDSTTAGRSPAPVRRAETPKPLPAPREPRRSKPEPIVETPATTVPTAPPSLADSNLVPPPEAAAAAAEESPLIALEPTEQEFLRRAEIPGVGPVELGGIAWSGDRPFALVNGRVVRPGDSIAGLVVDEIQPNTVRFRGETGTLVFKLK